MAARRAGWREAASCRGDATVGNAQGAWEPPLGAVVVVAVVVGCVAVVVTVGGWVCVVVSVVVVVGSFGAVRVIVFVVGALLELSPPPVMSSAAITPATMMATPAMTHGHGFESRGGGAP